MRPRHSAGPHRFIVADEAVCYDRTMTIVPTAIRHAQRRAWVATISFFGLGLIGTMTTVTDWQIAVPLMIFYFVMLVNSFFSIRYFALLEPLRDRRQFILDLGMIVTYASAPFFFSYPVIFSAICTTLFVLGSIKYFVLTHHQTTPILIRKTRIDYLTAVFGFPVTWLMTTDHVLFVAWAFAIGNIIVNYELLIRRPLYPFPPTDGFQSRAQG